MGGCHSDREHARCPPKEVVGILEDSLRFGLPLSKSLQEAFIQVRYATKKQTWNCMLFTQYNGLHRIAYEAGWHVTASVVRKNDEFVCKMFHDVNVTHNINKMSKSERGDIIGVVAVGTHHTIEKEKYAIVIDNDELLKIAKDKGGFAWKKYYDPMCRKSGIKKTLLHSS